MDLHSVSLNYKIKLAWSIIPIGVDKKPLVQWKKYQNEFPQDHELEEWFKEKTIGIGLVTGAISDVVVVDVDTMETTYGLNSPIKVKTSKGWHFYYRYEPIQNKTRVQGKLVDVRGDGGYVVLPPTVHSSGHIYKWEIEGKLTEAMLDLPPLPDWIKEETTDNTKRPILFVQSGNRDVTLFKNLCAKVDHVRTYQELLDYARLTNSTYEPPLEDTVVIQKVNQAKQFAKNPLIEDIPKPRTMESLNFLMDEMDELAKLAPSTGYKTLDEIVRGFIPTHLYTLTGETNVGKTAIASNFAYNVWKQGRKVLYLALEPDVNIQKAFRCLHFNKNWDEVGGAENHLFIKGLEVLLQEDCPTVEILKQIIEKESQRVDFIIVDHIGYFVRGEINYLQEQSNLIKELKFIIKKNKNALLLIAHPRKINEKAQRITMNDISGTASFKQDSTEVFVFHREKEKDSFGEEINTDMARLYVDKTKESTGSGKNYILLKCSKQTPKITERKEVYISAEEINNILNN